MSNQKLYKIIFQKQNEVYELFAKQVYQSELWNFLEVEEMIFTPKSQIVIDPSEEKLRKEFDGVKRSFIPIQSIIRIDEVDHQSQVSKIISVSSKDKKRSNQVSFNPKQ